MKSEQIKKITYTGVFAALIFLAVYLVHVPVGASGSYIHLGDAFIYLAAVVLPLPYAMVAAAVGAGLSDFLSPGGMVWLPATLLIKPLLCVAFKRGPKLLTKRNIVAVFIASTLTIVGYSFAAWILFGNIGSAIAELPISLLQAAGSGLLFVLLCKALSRMKKGSLLLQ